MDQMKTAQDIYAVIEKLSSEDVQVRLNTVRKIPALAAKIGPERTQAELFPALLPAVDDEEEVLLALADVIQEIAEQSCRGPEFATVLRLLEALAISEEPSVREKTAEVIVHLMEFGVYEFEESIENMARSEWYTSRSTAAAVIPALYSLLQEEPQALNKLRALFCQLCADEEPTVRRAAVLAFGHMVELVEVDVIKKELVPVFQKLAGDSLDSVRLLAVMAGTALCSKLGEADFENIMLPHVQSFGGNKSWRVRYVLADNFPAFCEIFVSKDDNAKPLPAFVLQKMVPLYLHLLRDTEAEVRTVAALKLVQIGRILPKEMVTSQLIPCVRSLATDQTESVRASVAMVATELAELVGKAGCSGMIDSVVLPLLEDESTEVRINIITNLNRIIKVLGIEGASQSLLPEIISLAKHPQWRIRMAIIELIPVLAAELNLKHFDDDLGELCISWLRDSVFAIRQAAIENIRKLTTVFGLQWAQECIIPSALLLHSHPNYLHRMTVLNLISELTPLVGTKIATNALLPIVLRMSQDSVPNIRFNVAKTLQKMVPHLDSDTLLGRVRPCLELLVQDPDNDVKIFGTKALAVC